MHCLGNRAQRGFTNEGEHNLEKLIKIDSVLANEIRVSDGMYAQYHSKALLIPS